METMEEINVIEIIAILTPFLLLILSGIGWMIKRMFDDSKDRVVKQEAQQERDTRLIKRLDELEQTLTDVRTQTLKIEFLQLISDHPDEETSITHKYDKLKKLNQNSYVDTEFEKWRKERRC